jgi:SSS family solute:Na+ symporter/sodium/pantothenate symporter
MGQKPQFVFGLIVFALVVVSYTVFGGFLAAVWTDVFQSVLMAIGVLILLPLALMNSGGLESSTAAGVRAVGEGFAHPPGAGRDFLPITLALSFFCMWSIAGLGQPATLVRLMAFKDTPTLRKAMALLAVYNTLIYLPLIFIFICARGIFPTLERPDEVMPKMAVTLATPAIAGLILAAPFGAVMATVSAYLVQISSAFVQDIYHRWVNPHAPESTLRKLSYVSIILIALIAAAATMKSPKFLQAIIVFAGGMAACTFLVPCLMAAYWPRATARGAIAAMLGGALTALLLYVIGWWRQVDPAIGEKSTFAPYYLFGFAPYMWGWLASVLAGVGFTLADRSGLSGSADGAESVAMVGNS